MKLSAGKKLSSLRLSQKRASALVTVCIFSAIILLIAGGSIASITFQTRSTGRSLAYKQSLALAEAGAEVALATLNTESNTWSGWTSQGSDKLLSDVELEDADGDVVGTYSVTVKDADTNTPLISAVGSAQIGSSGPVTREVRIPVKGNLIPSTFGPYGLYSKTNIRIDSNATTDGFDRTKGPYGAGNQGLSNSIAAAGNIHLSSNARVGDVQAGGSITYDSNVQYGNLQPNNMPTAPPDFPDDALAAAKLNNNNHNIEILSYKKNQGETLLRKGVPANGKYDFTSNNINGGGTLRLRFPAGTYYLDKIQINSNVDIITEGPVELYMDPESSTAILLSSNTSAINDTGDTSKASDLKMFIKGGSITLNSNCTVFAGIYAPNSYLHLNSNTNIYGAVVANSVQLNSQSHFYMDKSLTQPANAAGFLAEAWTEVSATY